MTISFLILGAGRFGRLAVARISQRNPASTITVVDGDPVDLRGANGRPVETVVRDGIDYLCEHLRAQTPSLVVVPSIPVHVAFEWLLRALAGKTKVERAPVPGNIELPNATLGRTGDLYASHADFLCPDDCPEPPKACPITKESRGKPMFQRIAELSSPALPVRCIRSEQIAPGVGGYRMESLLSMQQQVAQLRGLVLIGTACSCHGVVSALRLSAERATAGWPTDSRHRPQSPGV
ncbi:MAG: hypothetical protein DRI90_11285 [Deltaproteobacteria bacterium]|nr:MAG: hypothetical protein DRI90_11285 [Deltaproteobacteria bacterium]